MTRIARTPTALTKGYWQRSQEPLAALFFLLPFLVIYELGLLKLAQAKSRPIIAEVLLQKFFQAFGVHDPRLSYHLPAFVIIGVLLCWHLARRDKWTFDFRAYVLMFAESLLLAAPLFVFGLMLFRETQPVFAILSHETQVRLLESIGAGLYEEFVFRVIGIALVHALLVDVLALPQKWGAAGAIALTAIVFSAAHFYAREFRLGLFLYFGVAGIFFAIIYLLRGFGIAAATHAIYDIFIALQILANSDASQ